MKSFYRSRRSASIPIVPMLDILTILLIFFIVHTQLKTQQNTLKINLPRTHYLAGEKVPDDFALLEISSDGQLALQGQLLSGDELGSRIRELLVEHPDLKIQVSAAEGTPLGSLIQVTDILTGAGIDTPDLPVRIDFHPFSQD